MAYDGESMIATAIERLNEKMDKHEDKLDGLALAVQKLIAVDIEIRELKASNERVWQEIRGIKEDRVTFGCSAFKEFRTAHDNELRHNVAKIDDHEIRIKAIEIVPMTRIETIARGFFVALGGGIFAWVLAHWKGN